MIISIYLSIIYSRVFGILFSMVIVIMNNDIDRHAPSGLSVVVR